MINYIAAIATAITLSITPAIAVETVNAKKETVNWTKPSLDAIVEVRKSIEISGARPPYVLSTLEQDVLRKTLLRGIRIVDGGSLA